LAKKIKEIRTEELLQAALATLKDVGIPNTTVAMVAKSAGMAPGMVHHYFKNKDALIEGALRYANSVRRDEILDRIREVDCPKQRLFTIIDANFWESRFNEGSARMWITFCGQVPFNHQFFRIQRILHKRLYSNLRYNLLQLMDDEHEVTTLATGLSNLIDGLWLQAAVQKEAINAQHALSIVDDYLKRFGIER
jgi:TetR/AcrR family transcriptional repressor of bet genes